MKLVSAILILMGSVSWADRCETNCNQQQAYQYPCKPHCDGSTYYTAGTAGYVSENPTGYNTCTFKAEFNSASCTGNQQTPGRDLGVNRRY